MKKLITVFSALFLFLCLSGFSSFKSDKSNTVSKPLIAEPTNAFFSVRPDFRKCISPVCGGWFVKAVNLNTLQCPDGSVKQECYVGSDIIKIPGLSPDQIAQLRQAMHESNALILGSLSNSVPYGLLVINSAWLSATDQLAKGVFVSVSFNGIVCITHPCPSFDGLILNKNLVKSLAEVNLDLVNATADQLLLAQQAIATPEGLPMAGQFVEVSGPAGTAQGIQASQFYLKLQGSESKMCMPTGCSNQICADSPVMTTCEWRPEYACYRNAVCTKQSNGDCGWVMDDELQKCLDNSSSNNLLLQ